MTTLIKIAYRNIWRNKRRTVFCLSAVGMAVFFIVLYSGLIDGMTKNFNAVVQTYELGHVRIVSQDYEADREFMPVQYPVADGKNWREIADSITQNISGIRAIFPRIVTSATLQDGAINHATLWGIDAAGETAINNLNLVRRDNGSILGRFPNVNSNECAVGKRFAEKTGLTIGDRVPLKTISAQFSDRIWSPEIVGIFDFDYPKFDERYIVVDFERLQRLLVLDSATQQLIIFADDENASAHIAAQVEILLARLNENASAQDVVVVWRDDYWVAMLEASTPIYTLMFMVFLIVASFLIINTVVMIIHERIKEIGMMGCLGMTRREIVTVFFFESLFLSGIGALCGVILGGVIVGVGSMFPLDMVSLYGNQFDEMPVTGSVFLHFSIWKLFEAWLMGVVVASVFTLVPALKSAWVEPVEALRR